MSYRIARRPHRSPRQNATLAAAQDGGLRGARPAAGAPRRRHRGHHGARSPPSRSPSRPGASAPAARASPAFPGPGEPRDIFDKLEDCATIQQLTRATPTCSPHFPWDKVNDSRELAERAKALGLGFDAVNSNTFQDQPGQALSYKFGSLTHSQTGRARPGGRAQHRVHRDRREARLEGADGVDRRRLQLPRPVEPEQASSTGTSIA